MHLPKISFITFSLMAYQVKAIEPITLHYVDRPPYAITMPHGRPSGLVATPAEEVFKKAKIPFIWANTPVNRQFNIIKSNTKNQCSLGMEKTESRSAFAKFTEPVYISQPLMAIMPPEINEKSTITLAEMISKYSILVKENYTLGDELTSLVMKSPKKQMITSESIQMVRMIAHARADFMLISNDEVEYYINKGILDPKSIRVRKIADVNKNFTRRIMCSKAVDDKIIAKLDAVIKTLNVKPAPMKNLETLH